MAENVKKFLGNELQTVESEFAVQDNKTRKFWSEPAPSTLEAFF
jgi:hypothetical protein